MPPTATTWVLTTTEAKRHIEALTEAMDLLTRRYPDELTALLYGRLRDLRDLIERGAEDVVPVDHWQRPWLCKECGRALEDAPMGGRAAICDPCRQAWIKSVLRLREGHTEGEY
jgi:hypothetical protein